MAKKNQHWEVVFRMQTQDEWMWKNLPFTLKFEDKESAFTYDYNLDFFELFAKLSDNGLGK